jgi:double-stranded RNA-binding protein Staufen
MVKKKSRNLIKEKLEASSGVDEINPISQLIQIQQARKEKEPVYTVVDERGTARRREFVIEVSAGGLSASGTGPNKKLAKKIAAESKKSSTRVVAVTKKFSFLDLLIVMGIGKSSISESPPAEKSKAEIDKTKKVQFIEPEAKKSAKVSPPVSGGRQIVPGLLLVSSASDDFSTPSKSVTTTAKTSSPSLDDSTDKSASPSSTTSTNDSGIGVSARDQLSYLAQLIGFTVNYSDFPKGNHSEFLSLVTLTTDPPHMSHGSGSSVDASRDHAAMKALGVLSELGLDNVKPKAK